MKLLQDNVDFQSVFSELGSQDVVESFVCLWYSQPKKVTQLADACLNSFLKSYITKKNDFQSIKACDASLMPLCGTVLLEKIKRTNFVMSIWKYAHLSSPPNTFELENNGWTLICSNYFPKWFVGDMSLPYINFISIKEDITEEFTLVIPMRSLILRNDNDNFSCLTSPNDRLLSRL